jgi:hypothetical protein
LTTEDSVFRGVRIEDLHQGTVRSTMEYATVGVVGVDNSSQENWVEFWRWQSKVIEKKWQERN